MQSDKLCQACKIPLVFAGYKSFAFVKEKKDVIAIYVCTECGGSLYVG